LARQEGAAARVLAVVLWTAGVAFMTAAPPSMARDKNTFALVERTE